LTPCLGNSSSLSKKRKYLQNISPRTIEWYEQTFNWLRKYEPPDAGCKAFVLGMREGGLEAISCNSRIRVANAYFKWAMGFPAPPHKPAERRATAAVLGRAITYVKRTLYIEEEFEVTLHPKPFTTKVMANFPWQAVGIAEENYGAGDVTGTGSKSSRLRITVQSTRNNNDYRCHWIRVLEYQQPASPRERALGWNTGRLQARERRLLRRN